MSTHPPLTLNEEARLIADYARLTGCLRDHSLFDRLQEAERAQQDNDAAPGNPDRIRAVQAARTALAKILHDTTGIIPYHVRAELSETRDAREVKRRENGRATRLALFSIVMMLILTWVLMAYWSGTAARQAYEGLIVDNARTEYMRRLWEYGGGVPTDNESELAAGIASESELRALAYRISATQAQGGEFLNNQSLFPIPGMRFAYCHGNRLVRMWLWETSNLETRYRNHCQGYDNPADWTEFTGFSTELSCEPAGDAPDSSSATLVTRAQGQEESVPPTNRMLAAERRLACQSTPTLLPGGIYDFEQQVRLIERRQAFYAMLLPSLFGAFGALVYHLRRLTNPRLPNASRRQLYHRMVMGALGGMLLSWLSLEPSAFGGVLPDPGLTTFMVAFIMGFSLNVLFTLLERLVDTAEATIAGAPTRDPAQVPPATG